MAGSPEATSGVGSALLAQEVAVRVVSKQRDAASQQADALVALIEQARQQQEAQQRAAARGGIDVLA